MKLHNTGPRPPHFERQIRSIKRPRARSPHGRQSRPCGRSGSHCTVHRNKQSGSLAHWWRPNVKGVQALWEITSPRSAAEEPIVRRSEVPCKSPLKCAKASPVMESPFCYLYSYSSSLRLRFTPTEFTRVVLSYFSSATKVDTQIEATGDCVLSF